MEASERRGNFILSTFKNVLTNTVRRSRPGQAFLFANCGQECPHVLCVSSFLNALISANKLILSDV